MEITASPAAAADRDELVRLYRLLEREMVALKPVWRLTEGLPEPLGSALDRLTGDDSVDVLVGRIDDVPVGFLIGVREALLPQAEGRAMASVRYIFTEEPARQVGVGEAMMSAFLDAQRAEGIQFFDAHVSPGHRLAKNFFESNGFTARHIVMHHAEE